MIRGILFAVLVLIAVPDDGVAQRQSQFIEPAATDPAIDQWTEAHYVSLNPSAAARNRLFLFFPGTGGLPRNYRRLNEWAADLGFHAVNLRYPNDRAVNTLCALRLDLDCYGAVRLEIVDGADRTNLVEVNRTNSIENRLIKLVQYLDATAPGEGWGQYLTDEGAIHWPQVVVAGHSQGGGHAGIIAGEHEVARVVMFAAMDFNRILRSPAAWIDADNPTPTQAYYALGHVRDELLNVDNLLTVWEAYGMATFGPVVNVDTVAAPFGGTRRLLTDVEAVPSPFTPSPYHNSVAVDINTPLGNDGTPALAEVWTYLLTADDTGVAVEHAALPDGFRLHPNYPNPFRTATEIRFTVPRASPVSLRIYDALGRVVATLVSRDLPAGDHAARWDAGGLPGGVYFYELRAAGQVARKAMTRVR